MTDDWEIRRNLPSNTLDALEKEISDILDTCQDFIDKDTNIKLRQINNGNVFDYDTNTNIEKLAQDMTCILESFKKHLTKVKSVENILLKRKLKEIRDEKLIEKEKKSLEQLKKKEKGNVTKKQMEIEKEIEKVVEKERALEALREEETLAEHQKKPNEVREMERQKETKQNSHYKRMSDEGVRSQEYSKRNGEINRAPLCTPKNRMQILPEKNKFMNDRTTAGNRSSVKFRASTCTCLPDRNKTNASEIRKSTQSRDPSVLKRSTSPTQKKNKQNIKSEEQVKSVPHLTNFAVTQKGDDIIRACTNVNLKLSHIQTVESIKRTFTANLQKPLASPSRNSKTSTPSISLKSSKYKISSSEKPSSLVLNTKLDHAPYRFVRTSSNSCCASVFSIKAKRSNAVNKTISNPFELLKSEVDEAITQKKTFTVRGNYPVIRQALLRRGWVEKLHASYRNGTREFKHYLALTFQELYDLTKLVQTHQIAKKVLRSKLLGLGHQVDLFWGPNCDSYKECFDRIKMTLINRIRWTSVSYTNKHGGELKKFLSLSKEELLELSKRRSTTRLATIALKAKMLSYKQVDMFWGFNYDGYTECCDRFKMTLFNKIRWKGMSYTLKPGLCEASRQAFWYHLPGISKLNVPRSYRLAKEGDAEEFVKDFNATAAMSLLKWVKTRFEIQHGKLMTPNGKVPLRMFDFAINECYKYLKKARHEDIDQDVKDALPHEWNEFLEYFYKIVHVGNLFKLEEHVTESDMLRRANYVLERLRGHYPYLDMDGELNIWILKPTNSCRGIGIHMCRTLKYVLDTVRSNPNRRYIIQKYIERPLLIYNTKFDIRQWFLISSTVPITIWIYKMCYLRFSSQTYDLKKLHESIHITNNSVQCKYRNIHQDHHLPAYCMWDSNEFKTYLIGKGKSNIYNEIVYPEMKKCITAAVLMHQENMEKRKNSFEVYGADFILTEDFKPWLLEINANPALHASTPVTAKLCPKLMEDVIRVVVDYERNKCANTGYFEMIYKGTLTKDKQCKEILRVDGQPLSPDYFYRPKWSPKETEPERSTWGMNKKIKNLSKNPDSTDFGLVSVTGMKQTLNSLLELLKKEKDRRRIIKRRTGIEELPYQCPELNSWLDETKTPTDQRVS